MPTLSDRDDNNRATDEGMPEGYFERPNWPDPKEASDMAALDAVNRLKVKKDPDFLRTISNDDTERDQRESTRQRLQRWWNTR